MTAGSRDQASPVASSTDPALRRLGEQVRALFRSQGFLQRLIPGSVLRAATGAAVQLAWGAMNRTVLSGDALAWLPTVTPETIGVPMQFNKLTGSGVANLRGSGGLPVDGQASGILVQPPGTTWFTSDGAGWYSSLKPGATTTTTSASGVLQGALNATAFRLPNTFNPIGLWHFDSNLNDYSGNNIHLAVEAGTLRYAPIHPGAMGAILGGGGASGCRLISSMAQATMLGLKGDMSVETIIWQEERPNGILAGPWVSYAGAGGLEADNALWSLFTNANNGPEWYQESGSSVPSTLGLNEQVLPPPAQRPVLVGGRRASGILQFFFDGKPYGSLVGTGLTLPTGGTASEFRVGGSQAGTQAPKFLMSSLKVVATGLSNADFLADYNNSLGGYYGTRT